MSIKKKTPESVGGYSYKKIITRKNKNGTKLFYEKTENGSLKRLKKEEKIKQENTKKYFKTKFDKDWSKEFKKAQNKFNTSKFKNLKSELTSEEKKYKEHHKKEIELTKSEYLKKLGYPIEETAMQASIITDTEINVIEGYDVYLIYSGKRIKITKKNVLEFRQAVEEMLSFYFEAFHESLTKSKKNKDVSSLLQIPRAQISGGKYPIIYEIYFDNISITAGAGDAKQKVNEVFYNKVKNKFNSIFKKYF